MQLLQRKTIKTALDKSNEGITMWLTQAFILYFLLRRKRI